MNVEDLETIEQKSIIYLSCHIAAALLLLTGVQLGLSVSQSFT